MYLALVTVMREVVADLETSYRPHPRAQHWHAALLAKLAEYGELQAEQEVEPPPRHAPAPTPAPAPSLGRESVHSYMTFSQPFVQDRSKS